jgi:hypothetical protein
VASVYSSDCKERVVRMLFIIFGWAAGPYGTVSNGLFQ